MKKAYLSYGILAAITLLMQAASFAASTRATIGPGEPFPNLPCDESGDVDDMRYLGVDNQQNGLFSFFSKNDSFLKNVAAEIIVIEFLNTCCVTCQAQIIVMAQCYNEIAAASDLKHKVKSAAGTP